MNQESGLPLFLSFPKSKSLASKTDSTCKTIFPLHPLLHGLSFLFITLRYPSLQCLCLFALLPPYNSFSTESAEGVFFKKQSWDHVTSHLHLEQTPVSPMSYKAPQKLSPASGWDVDFSLNTLPLSQIPQPHWSWSFRCSWNSFSPDVFMCFFFFLSFFLGFNLNVLGENFPDHSI